MAAVFIWAEAEAAVRISAVVAVPSTEAVRTLAEPVILVACVNSMEAAAMSVHRAPSQGRMECARIRGGMQAMPSTVEPAKPRGQRPGAMALQPIARRGGIRRVSTRRVGTPCVMRYTHVQSTADCVTTMRCATLLRARHC